MLLKEKQKRWDDEKKRCKMLLDDLKGKKKYWN
jgi:hypothetical protein